MSTAPSHSFKSGEVELVLPNFFQMTPFTCAINPHYNEVREESIAWTESFRFFDGPESDDFRRCDFELLAALLYPAANREDYRTLSDCMNSYFVFENMCDERDGKASRILADTYLMALKGEACEQSGTPFYLYVSEIAARLRSKDLPRFYRRFIANHSNYLNAVVRESDLRLHRVELSFDEFMDVRRMTIGVHSCVDLLEFFLDIDLPDELFESDAFIRMRNAAANAVGLKNDLISYKREHGTPLAWLNSVTVLTNTLNMTLQEAADHIGLLYQSNIDAYNKNKRLIPSFGEKSDRDVEAYLRAMDYWIIGLLEWDFRSKRYLGDKGEEVKLSHVVPIAV